MATVRGSASSYSVGNNPPLVTWTVVRGDTAAFRVYVTDDERQPLNIPDWTISMKMKRPNTPVVPPVMTDSATTLLTLTPAADPDDLAGEFTVSGQIVLLYRVDKWAGKCLLSNDKEARYTGFTY